MGSEFGAIVNDDKLDSTITTAQRKTATISPANLATFQPQLDETDTNDVSVT